MKVERDAQDLADREGLTIFTADIIYHLFDKFTAYTEVRRSFKSCYTVETHIKEPTFLGNSLLKALICCLYNPYIRDG